MRADFNTKLNGRKRNKGASLTKPGWSAERLLGKLDIFLFWPSRRFGAPRLFRLGQQLHHVCVGDDHIRITLERIEIMVRKAFAKFGWSE